jgi:hypothetical protein
MNSIRFDIPGNFKSLVLKRRFILYNVNLLATTEEERLVYKHVNNFYIFKNKKANQNYVLRVLHKI